MWLSVQLNKNRLPEDSQVLRTDHWDFDRRVKHGGVDVSIWVVREVFLQSKCETQGTVFISVQILVWSGGPYKPYE